MRRYVTYSVLFHLGVVVFAYLGLPSFRDIEPAPLPVSVEILTVAEVTNVPTKVKEPPKPAEKPTPPPLAPEVASKAPPTPPEPEAPAPDDVALVPEAKPKPKSKAKQKPKPEDKPSKASPRPKPKPKKKPAPPDPFASVLKTLEDLKSAPPVEDEKPKEKSQPTFEEQMENALETKTQRQDIGPSLTISEIDLVRQQIARCWNLPAGAKDAHEMVVDLRVLMNPDGTVSNAQIENQAQMALDPFFRAMAESALRAVLNPNCSPLKLPPEKYENWKELSLQFNPKEMFGL
ncbi:MAG: cell envelope integrity protein TolA [Rhodospirillaceae bacterium]|nr:cell envelope integrity protein TolA [Rhodospirillaceae bacterium]